MNYQFPRHNLPILLPTTIYYIAGEYCPQTQAARKQKLYANICAFVATTSFKAHAQTQQI